MDFTPSQKEAITYSGENILLSAAAGSGKTAVLVQRVIEKILNKENPTSVNELLILTFTEAAAAEMKRKIAKAINEEFLKSPNDPHLKKQRILINSANISTIHAFCLEIIRANINNTDIPVDFSIISTIENKIMTQRALDSVMARFYENMDKLPSFKSLVLSYGSDKGDGNLREIILRLMNFAQSMAHPARWLNDSAQAYKAENFKESVWHSRLFKHISEEAENVKEIYDEILRLSYEELSADHPYVEFFRNEAERFNLVFSEIKGENYEKTRDAVLKFEFNRLPAKKSKEIREQIIQGNIKALRNLAKDISKTLSGHFLSDEEQALMQLKENEPQIRTLKNIVLMTMRAHKKMKRQAGYLDFNDLEHETIKLLEGKENAPSSVAVSLRERFKEILVDEYQDTNNAQERIFSLVSRENTNVFTVGDIKQCIYKFRNAVPEIFSGKSRLYKENKGGHLICLAKNFRSRKEVLDLTNFVFEKIMTERSCGINYDAEERLEFGADYYPPAERAEEYLPEFNIVDGREMENSSEVEAESIAERIRRLVREEKLSVTDPKTGEKRNLRYSDIVILLRNTKRQAGIFEEVFARKGIPLYTDAGQSYLTSKEVQTVLSYLQIIDNPYQDIPLIAVMRSPIWRFTPEELAEIRSGSDKREAFYDSVKKAAENGNESCARFIKELEDIRFEAEYLSVHDLVLIICNRYNYREIVSGEEGGIIKSENLRLLFERAAEYDAMPNSSLFGFMIYIQTFLDEGLDLTPAKIDGETADAVKIMSIHKSKGLEFPVVILGNVFARFNTEDTSKSILWHDTYGFGVPYVDIKKRIKYPSIPHKLISKVMQKELMAEEMRILYVAMTRAKEKLIISAIIKKQTSAWASPYLAQDKLLTAGILNAKAIGDWLSYSLARSKEAEPLLSEAKLIYDLKEREKPLLKVSLTQGTVPEEDNCESKETEERTERIDSELMEKLKHNYDDGGAIPVKLSVSEAKRRQNEEELYSPHIFTIPTISATDISMISATDKGTITHFVLQHLDFSKTKSPDEINDEINNMVSRGIINPTQREAVDYDAIYRFFGSEIGKRLKKAVSVRKEFSFYAEADAGDFYPEQEGKGRKILLQGTMDCFFEEENGNIVLLDYKTDNVSERDIKERGQKYYHQLKYYKAGLEAIVGRAVKEAYVCFLSCGKNIGIDELKNNE